MVGNPRRRVEDNPDWKMAAPRWILVAATIGFGTLAYYNIRQHVKHTDMTALRVESALSATAEVKRETEGLREVVARQTDLVAETRIDMLRYQSYMARKNRDNAFAQHLDERLRDAEARRDREARARAAAGK